MKANATQSVPLGGAFWDGGAKSFIHKGKNGRWRDTLSQDDVRNYEDRAVKELGPECAKWLADGNFA
jgi:aryl sulfotransferase